MTADPLRDALRLVEQSAEQTQYLNHSIHVANRNVADVKNDKTAAALRTQIDGLYSIRDALHAQQHALEALAKYAAQLELRE